MGGGRRVVGGGGGGSAPAVLRSTMAASSGLEMPPVKAKGLLCAISPPGHTLPPLSCPFHSPAS